MGTGAVSALLDSFPYGHKPVLHAFGAGFLLLNVILLFVLLGFAIIRYAGHPEVFKMMFMDPLQSLYIGCLPMGFGTIINALLNLRDNYFPESQTFVYVLWGLWWFDTVISVPVYFLILYTMISRHEHSTQGLNAVWILPAITLIVPATTGALLSQALVPYSTRHTIISLFVSTAALVLGLGLALMLMALYILRLITVGLPDKTLIATKFIPNGPCGQGGWACIVLGQVAAKLAKEKVSQSVLLDAAQPLALLGFAAGYVLWAFGIWWVVLAIVATHETFWKNPPKYNAGFWGMVFPIGVYSMLTISLSEVLDSPFFRIVASVLCIFVFALWTTLAVLTVRDLIKDRQELLNTPFVSTFPQPRRTQNESGLGDRSSSTETVC
ncbi:C4-dicarboxylate transporter/malic acid transporter [Rhizoctonia solani AG-3 Rhs1AP]|nr:C4-dicarboxylate transporter/malic acid transporter [Rhizoctonia solani AG-3 Rhs1AP]